jgi:hypothetical protein
MVIILSNLFKNENLNKLGKKMLNKFTIPGKVADKVLFLLNLDNFKVESIFDIYKKKAQIRISDEQINNFLSVNDINDVNLLKFTKFRPSVSSQELMANGFKGKALGDEIKRLEMENFKKIK